MVAKRSILKVADNSGAKRLRVIGIGKGSGTRFAKLGDLVTCAVFGANPMGQVKDHEIVKAVIVRTKKETRRKDGSYIRFSDNAAVIVDANKIPRATRIFGPMASEIKDKGFVKIASLAKEVI
ncbi:MAG: 50S ribosomal protein L14 [Candidatus Curtissbacteria bacterium GW2011_GWA1_40_47]|uniref:Large ribosomal subunit protein uL14 n=1 Tax=Candidatus Curtissbacteria bacterium RIFOXYA1_FULL_41_14 TaxID=1797737 RepID=A0A1F5HC29_9BACT|nr:MAG: 50S ribosomal protein L14 [Candidatus Curtissbacteria bacterium GW2011_GWB1_40_28]KKR61219.1 MAG: 50S ribosomal protein L14 [Candidatus Curtissbacteria bacterium GW2011_GWA2_40_31]KKR62196.1 MAG: 50S ribosomal protein L14 [Microgenomates group bacterium GW2011_GWC1_40_35]KKR66215.1 MAG: 50S ribosomal protein L14 [Candidatus Curtissbacteria bacterium GW2011_GWA1_40_47]KKR75850.1 MAG: 50S ribosomal protein L14 [Candidatus Curtissbacteria bacterium GW2011_GWD1_40_8]KKS02324.1 MAG: 50S rib